jgi:long-chain fatty acid transport protein
VLTATRVQWRRASIVAALWAVFAHPAFAQSTAQFPVQFDFTSPGARSMAMGGAFVGAANDATAAFTNPAGLAFYGAPEITGEGRFTSLSTPFLAGGRISGTATGMGLDTVSRAVYERDVFRRFGVTFVSATATRGLKTTFTAYRHELVRVNNSFFSQGVFQRATFGGVTDDANRELPIGGSRDVAITVYGAAVGRQVTDTVAVGVGLSVSHLHLESRFARFGLESNSFSAADRTLVSATASQDGDDVAVAANVGLLWKPNAAFSAGAAFRRGPRFSFTQHDHVAFPALDLERSGHFKVPDVFSIGMSWQTGNLRTNLDYSRIRYSQLKEDFIEIQALASGRPEQLRLDDGGEIRGGAEYFIGDELTIIPRIGLWFDPDHTVQYVSTAAADATDARYSAALPGHDGLIHYTFGVGVVWSRSIETHFAADLSSRTRQVTVSAVKRF